MLTANTVNPLTNVINPGVYCVFIVLLRQANELIYTKTDRTDYSEIVFNVDSSSDSENEFEYLDYDDQRDEEVKKALRTTDAPHRVLLDRKVASTGEPPARRAFFLDTEKVNVSAHTHAIGRCPFFHQVNTHFLQRPKF